MGEGLGFIFWNMKTMNFPFIGGRIKTDLLTQNITRNLNLKLEIYETSSIKKAWSNIKENIDKGIVVIDYRGIKSQIQLVEKFIGFSKTKVFSNRFNEIREIFRNKFDINYPENPIWE